MREYIAIDVETTGLSPAKERMIELAAVRFQDGKEPAGANCRVDRDSGGNAGGCTKRRDCAERFFRIYRRQYFARA